MAATADVARTAERGLFDFLVDAPLEGARSDTGHQTFPALAALSGLTRHIGLIGTAGLSGNEPFELSRQFATLDHLSDGRAGWNIDTAGTGVDSTDRYATAAEFVEAARRFWDSWQPGAVLADTATGVYSDPARIEPVTFSGKHFTVRGMATLPAGPAGYPVLVHAADTDEDRDFAARYADIVRLRTTTQADYADLKARATAYGRAPDAPLVFTTVTPPAHPARQIADDIDERVQSGCCDGVILTTPHGLDAFVDEVVPLLAHRGVFGTEYPVLTLRARLGLPGGR